MRPNDFCRLWKNHFEGLKPQTTKRGQMVFAGLGNYMGGLRSSITFGGLRPKTTKGALEKSFGGPETPQNEAK